MNAPAQRLHRKLRIAGSLIIAGLLVEFFSLLHIHALAFLTFMFVGGAFLVAGVAIYLYSIVATPAPRDNHPS